VRISYIGATSPLLSTTGWTTLQLTRPPSKLTPYGRQLRSELFAELHLIRDRLREAERQAQDEEIDRLAEEEALPIEAPTSVEAQQTTTPQ